jgi:hypothetical protein
MGEDAGRRLLRVYPSEAVRNNRSAAAEFELTIDPEGKLEKCIVLRTVGDEQLAGQTCALLKAARLRFTRATSADGTPAYGVIRSSSKFALPDTTLGRAIRNYTFSSFDMEVSLQALPDGVDDPAIVKVVAVVGEDGKVATCEPEPDARADLAEVACQQVRSREWDQVESSSGVEVSYVRGFGVQFTAKQGSEH